MISIFFYLIPFIFFIQPVFADNPSYHSAFSIPNLYYSNDSEGLNIYKTGAGYYSSYSDPNHLLGFNYQFNRYVSNQWSQNTNQYGFVFNKADTNNSSGYLTNLSVNTLNGSHLLVTDSLLNFKISPTTNGQLLLNRDRIESELSLQNRVYYTLTGASIEHQLNNRLTAVGLLGVMGISDGNYRWIFKGKLIYDLFPTSGINLQLRYRQFRDTNTQVPNYYFNPDFYSETLFGIGIKKRISSWTLSGIAGVGRQSLSAIPSTTTKLFEASLTSPVYSQIFFRARAGYINAGEFQGPTYSYRYFMNELIFAY